MKEHVSEIKRPSVLVVDDEEGVCKLLKNMLEDEYNIFTSTNVLEAKKIMEKNSLLAVISDYKMPGENGLKLLNEVYPAFAPLCPLILISGHGKRDVIIEALKAGVFDFVEKPFSQSEIKFSLRKAMELRTLNQKILDDSISRKSLFRVLIHDLGNSQQLITGLILRIQRKIKKNPSLSELSEDILKLNRSIKLQMELTKLVRDLESIQSNKVEIVKTNVSLVKILNDTQFMFSEQMEDKNITFVFNDNCDESCEIFVDEVLFKNSVLNNIVSNAIKFSDKGSHIRINFEQDETLSTLTVRDYGQGMDIKRVSNIFEIEAITSTLGTEGEEGTGFGMFLIKTCVNMMGGEVFVKSWSQDKYPEDHGTEFTIRLKRN